MAGKSDDVLSPIDEARRSLYGRLRAVPPEALSRRTAPGDWSPLENVRHLLYAE